MDLIHVAYVAVVEQAFLWEVPLASTHYEGGLEIRSGPWDLEACSTVLTVWCDLGWVGVYMPTEQLDRRVAQPAGWMSRLTQEPTRHPTLGLSEAKDLLTTPSLWTQDRADGWAALWMADSAPAADISVWARTIPIPAD